MNRAAKWGNTLAALTMTLNVQGKDIMAGNTLSEYIKSVKVISPMIYNVFQTVPQAGINSPHSAKKGVYRALEMGTFVQKVFYKGNQL